METMIHWQDVVGEEPGITTTTMEHFTVVIDGEKHWRPPLRASGHSPDIRYAKNNRVYAGCSCGWRSRNRTHNGIASWWQHVRKREREALYV